jgi:hypothetical protein
MAVLSVQRNFRDDLPHFGGSKQILFNRIERNLIARAVIEFGGVIDNKMWRNEAGIPALLSRTKSSVIAE